MLVTQSCPTLCNPMDCTPPAFSVHGIIQARILEWVAISSYRESCQPREQTQFSCIAGKFFTIWATGEAPCKDQCKAFRERHLFILGGSKITADHDCSHEIKRCLLLGRKAMINLDSILKSRHHFANKGLYSQSYGFCSSHVWMWQLNCKER